MSAFLQSQQLWIGLAIIAAGQLGFYAVETRGLFRAEVRS